MKNICGGSSDQINVAPSQIRSKNPGDSAKVADVVCWSCGRKFTARANWHTNVATLPRHNAA